MMENKTWIGFTHENTPYLLKTRLLDDVITLYLTDLRSIWAEHLTVDILHQRFKDLNKSFDFDLEECKKEVLLLTENVGKTVIATVETTDANGTILHLNGQILDFSVLYEFKLALCDQEVYFAEVSMALVRTVKLLEEQRQSLCELLVQKDREISEYVMEKGDTISKKYLITEPFNRSQINSKDNGLMVGVLEQFWNTLGNEDQKTEKPEKKKKVSPKEKVKVYSSKSKKSIPSGFKYKAAK